MRGFASAGSHRTQTRIQRFTKRAHFPFLATIEDFDFAFQTSVRQALLGSFLGPELMVEGLSLILCGPAGVGKTHLAIALAYRAIQNGTTALFIEANRIMEDLSEASRLGRLSESMEPYLHAGVLVVDEVGYLSCPPDAANVLFQVVNQRYLRCRPMVFTTNKPLAAWADVLHDADLAEAIIDRVLARGRIIELRGPSYRTRHIKPPPLPPEEPARISGKDRQEFPEPTRPTKSADGSGARGGGQKAKEEVTGTKVHGSGLAGRASSWKISSTPGPTAMRTARDSPPPGDPRRPPAPSEGWSCPSIGRWAGTYIPSTYLVTTVQYTIQTVPLQRSTYYTPLTRDRPRWHSDQQQPL